MKVKRNKVSQTTLILIALILGVMFGLMFPEAGQSISFLGDIFLKLVQMGLGLLILGQVVAAVANLNLRDLGKLGSRTVGIFFLMSFLASIWAVIMGIIFKPGAGVNPSNETTNSAVDAAGESLIDVIVGFFPSNIMASLAEGSMIQITVFALIFGAALSFVRSEKELAFVKWLDEFNEIILQMIKLVMYFAPIGVFSLISSAMGNYGIDVLLPLIYYVVVFFGTVVSYMLIWHFMAAVYMKKSPWLLIKNTLNMAVFAFAVNSSAVALPTQMADSRNKLGISEEATSFIMPLGMSLNSPASAMSNAMVLVIAGQMHGLNYTLADYVLIVILATFASYATAVIPGGGLVSLNIVLPQMGFGPETIAIFASVDWPTGMTRTMGNVWLDASAGLIVSESLDEIDHDILNGEETK